MSTLKANKYQHVDRTSPSIEINADGSVSIASTVTYEDVTSVDAVGMVTARSGLRATAGGLVFASGTLDKLIRAFDTETGKELWFYKLPFIGSAPPTSYKIDNEQYIVIPATGGTSLKAFYGDLVELGDAIVAFKVKN